MFGNWITHFQQHWQDGMGVVLDEWVTSCSDNPQGSHLLPGYHGKIHVHHIHHWGKEKNIYDGKFIKGAFLNEGLFVFFFTRKNEVCIWNKNCK